MKDWDRVKEVFGEALALDVAERRQYLARVCGDDLDLYAEVERLLDADERADEFLEMPVGARASDGMVGRAIGPYVVRSRIGAGGMGTVYLAERADGAFEQRVAIKFVSWQLLSPILLARFKEERRILAALEHPYIARLLDGGATADGLPFVVMEYVDGLAIDEHCNTNHLSVIERIDVFRQVCEAVQYAHQRLVVHRDIKAGNILVSASGTPKLLDFGIAKLIDPTVTDQPQATLVRALSLEGASPEQVRGETVTVASDVYSLGVLLYRLLTNSSPYGIALGNDAESMRAICEVSPRPPSELVEGIDHDLDSIVLKAMRKEPDRRYTSVSQLSDDLSRYLGGLPVLAAPDSAAYRTKKFLRRHAVAVAASVAVLIAVVGGAAVALWQARVAMQERARAERRFQDVRRMANAFVFDFHDAIAELPGALGARQLVVKRAAEYLDGLAREAEGDVALQRELATAYERLATILGGGGVSNLGDLKGAEARYRDALTIRQALASRPHAEPADVAALAQLSVLLSRYHGVLGNLAQSEQYAANAVKGLQSARASAAATARLGGPLATAFHQLGYVQARRGEDEAALNSFAEAMKLAKAEVEAQPDDVTELARLARIATDYGEQLRSSGKKHESLETLRAARVTIERLLESDPRNLRYRQILQLNLSLEGICLAALGEWRAAIDVRNRAVAVAEAMHADSPDDGAGHIGLMMSRYQLAMTLIETGDLAAGTRTLRQAIADGEDILRSAPDNGYMINQVASAQLELGQTLLRSAPASAEGCREIDEGLRRWDSLKSRGGPPGEAVKYRSRFEALQRTCRR